MAPSSRPQTPNVPVKKTPQQEYQERIAALEQNQTRQDNRTRAVLRLSQFQDDVLARAESWMKAARNVGSAYKKAAEKHKEVLGEHASSQALKVQIIFSILSVATVGALSWVSSAVQRGKHELLSQLAESVEDASQTAADKVLGMGPLVYAPNLRSAVNPDPQVFQNELENSISDVKQGVYIGFGKIKMAWNSAPLDTWDTYVEVQQMAEHNKWKNGAAQLAGAEDLPTVQTMADALEIGIWAKYILEQHSHLEVPLVGWEIEEESYDYVGDTIYRRLAELYITNSAILPSKPPNREYETTRATNKLVAWAGNHKVPDFVALERASRQRPR